MGEFFESPAAVGALMPAKPSVKSLLLSLAPLGYPPTLVGLQTLRMEPG